MNVALNARARWADPRDDAALRALCRAVSMKGALQYSLEREPSYFALAGLQGDTCVAVVDGAQGGAVDAMGAMAFGPVAIRGRMVNAAYGCDARVHPDARRTGRLRDVMGLLIDEIGRRDIGVGYGLVLGGNRLMSDVLDHSRSARFQRACTVRNVSLWLGLTRTRRPEYTVRPATAADLGELASLWARCHAERDLVPVRGEPELRRLLGLDGAAATPGLTVEALRVVQRQGRITGFVLPWDASPIKQVRVHGLSPGLRAVRQLWNPPARWLAARCLPEDGERVPFRYLALPCAETPDDLAALITACAGEAEGSGALYLDLALDTVDPLWPALRGWPATHVDFDLVETIRRPNRPVLSPGRVHFFDMAFV